ncbi:hypothetical protein CGRA01v4_02446 [Colletotrichum graminicola]|nr:hypothetical protein CGRA01v4_02446 [Colletotrichum graminicola]
MLWNEVRDRRLPVIGCNSGLPPPSLPRPSCCYCRTLCQWHDSHSRGLVLAHLLPTLSRTPGGASLAVLCCVVSLPPFNVFALVHVAPRLRTGLALVDALQQPLSTQQPEEPRNILSSQPVRRSVRLTLCL